MRHLLGTLVLAVVVLQAGATAAPSAVRGPLDGRPDAVVDLNTAQGLQAVRGSWTTRTVALEPVRFRKPAADLSATGAEVGTMDIGAKPGTPGFEQGPWEPIAAGGLFERRGPGRSSFAWYRLTVTLPARIGALDVAGLSAVFEILVDDYAEVWVNGQLSRSLGSTGSSLVSGFNAPNRVVLSRKARPGQAFDIAVFAANGPLSEPPANYIWVRSATIDFYKSDSERHAAPLTVDRRDARLAAILPEKPALEHLASGFQFTEGPVWVAAEQSLLFSDPNDNTIYRWHDDTGITIFRVKSGYAGANIGEYHQPGSNGLALDPEGRLTIDEHGHRRVTRLEKNGVVTVIADGYDGKRFNSPNDLVYKSDGTLYFTDPPFGLPKVFEDPRKELPFSGVYSVRDGVVTLLASDLTGPNGLAFSPDERHLYVTNWDERRKIVMRYDVLRDGTLAAGRVFFDMTAAPGAEALDGVKVDHAGNLFVSGPGGVWVIAPDGTHLGTLVLPELAANMAWGGEDGRSLFLTARTGLYRLRTLTGATARAPGTDTRR